MMWHHATILSRQQLSPTVVGLTLKVHPPLPPPSSNTISDFTFLPGQWIDFKPRPCSSWKHPECGRIIGGYSLTGIPSSLPQIELAIQRSRHPVATWATTSAQPDDAVDVRVGGSFTYKGDLHSADRLLFIAGGVGINPLISMIKQWHLDQTSKSEKKSRAVLLYSCKERDQFLFVGELDKLAKDSEDGEFRVKFTTTTKRGSPPGDDEGGYGSSFTTGRIDSEMIKDAIRLLNQNGENQSMMVDAVFVCGPPGMPEKITTILSEGKFVQSTDDVHFERWW